MEVGLSLRLNPLPPRDRVPSEELGVEPDADVIEMLQSEFFEDDLELALTSAQKGETHPDDIEEKKRIILKLKTLFRERGIKNMRAQIAGYLAHMEKLRKSEEEES